MARAFAEIAFTPIVKSEQERLGSATAYAKMLSPEAERGDALSDEESTFITDRDGFYQATVTETGWPYVQFRGGPVGFLKVLDPHTIAYADFRGNRQYLSLGNLKADDRVSMILVDYPNRQRLKIWGRAKTIDIAENPDLVASLHDDAYRARPERAVIVTIEAFDWNCPAHIPQRLTLDELEPQLVPMRKELVRLAAENDALRASLEEAALTANP